MAVTGLVLIGFVAGHLVGNLQIFSAPDKINGYAHFLQGLGPALWIVRLTLLACVVLHVWAAIQLTLENRRARPEKYAAEHVIQASLASRYMRLTGLVVLAFIVYHVLHFTVGVAGADHYKGQLERYVMTEDFHLLGLTIVTAGTPVEDVYSMVFVGFANPLVSGFYIVAVGLLAFHLWHGTDSLFQTLGLRTHKWSGALRNAAIAFSIVYFVGNLAIPGAILAGVNKPAPGTIAHEVLIGDAPVTDFHAAPGSARH